MGQPSGKGQQVPGACVQGRRRPEHTQQQHAAGDAGQGAASAGSTALYEHVVLLADCWLHSLAQPVNTVVSTAAQIGRLQEKWQAHAQHARLGHNCCTLLRQQLVLNEPVAVEAELCE